MKNINITYDFLLSKNKNGEYNHIMLISEKNILYGKEIYIPKYIAKGRDYLFQALGCIGSYGNNIYDDTIDYIFVTDNTIDSLMLGVKNGLIQEIEDICKNQIKSLKNPSKWRFNLKLIIERNVVEFIKNSTEPLAIEQILKYEQEH